MSFAKTPSADGKLAGICVLLPLCVSGAVIGAAFDIESIVVTGPILSLSGLAVTLIGWGFRSSSMALFGISIPSFSMAIFGISIPSFSMAIFLWITFQAWSPAEAQLPVTTALIGYQLVILPVGWWALRQALSGPMAASGELRLQFSVRSLLIVTLIAAVSLGVMRLCDSRDVQLRLAVCLFVVAVLASTTLVARRLFGFQGDKASVPPANLGENQHSAWIDSHPPADI
jgi:hypothetical protein